MRIALTGASGMLGTSLADLLSKSHEIFATSRNIGKLEENIEWDCFDLTDLTLLNKWLYRVKPDLVIHCAAIINVDFCENDCSLATSLHKDTTEVLANYSEHNKTKLIYISTDSVFDGKKQGPYNELDIVNPLNIYAKTKFLGEKFVQSIENGLVLRVSIIGWTKKGRSSLVEWILKGLLENSQLDLFSDVLFSPITVYDLSLVIQKIIANPLIGLYHCAGSDSISKYDFGIKMAEVFQFSGSNINKTSIDNIDLKASRPKNMALDVRKISKALDISLPGFEDSLILMKRQYDNNQSLFD